MESIGNIRRTEIIQAFLKILAERGLAKATIREIADTAGCNPGLLHHYFSDKGEIIAASVEYALNVYVEDLLKGTEQLETATERLKFFIPAVKIAEPKVETFFIYSLSVDFHVHGRFV